MADPQSHGDHPDSYSLDEFFDLGGYFAEPLPTSNDVPNLEPAPQPSSGAGFSDVMTPWEAYNGQESDFDIPPSDSDILRGFENPMVDPHMAPSQPTGTRNDLSQQQLELANPNNPSDEVQELDRQIEDIELQLRLKALKQRRQELRQRSSIQTQTRPSNCFVSQDNQNPGAFGGSMVLGTSPASHSGMTSNNDQTSDTFSTELAHTGSKYARQPYRQSINNSSTDFVDTLYPAPNDQLGATRVDLLSFEPADLQDHSVLGPPYSDITSQPQFGVQNIPNASLDQPSMQPVSAVLPYRQSPDPTQSASTSSLPYRGPYSQNLNKTNRKRQRSPEANQGQERSVIRQLSKNTGVPEPHLGVLSFCDGPPIKRNRTKSQKDNKKDVIRAGGSCLYCVVYKRKCSGERPCDQCQQYWQKRSYDSTSFRWTCTIRWKLTDYDLFSSPSDMSQHPSVSEIKSIFTKQSATLWEDLVAVMDALEDQRMRLILLRSGRTLKLWTYIHSIVQWKESLLCLAPELCEVVGVFEMAEMQYLASVLWTFENEQSLDKINLIKFLVLIFDEVQRLGSTQRLDAALAGQLQLAIKSRLQVLCTSVFDFHPPKNPREKLKNLRLAQMVAHNKETSCCIPPHYRDSSYAYGFRIDVEAEALRHLDPNSLNSTSCLVSRSNSTDRHHDTNLCCCGWISDIIPAGILNWFGFSSKTFLRYFHCESVNCFAILFLTSEKSHRFMNTWLESWHLDNVSLLHKMTIFYQSFRTCLGFAIFAIEYGQESHDLTTTTLSQDQLLAQAGGHREFLFYSVLAKAGEIMHAFFISRGEGYTDTRNIRKALIEFREWEESKPSGLVEALSGICTIMGVILWLKEGGKRSDLEKASRKESSQDSARSLNSDG
ncbi:hypothetical protein BGZ57DRAFT_916761 [Hyaloscypha finlandica]|nr:hypothetical protein BGZ57DRAFT_916761 [Hyaloscypha finlandica]